MKGFEGGECKIVCVNGQHLNHSHLHKEEEKPIRRELIDELLKDYETPQDILGEGGLLKDLRHRGD